MALSRLLGLKMVFQITKWLPDDKCGATWPKTVKNNSIPLSVLDGGPPTATAVVFILATNPSIFIKMQCLRAQDGDSI